MIEFMRSVVAALFVLAMGNAQAALYDRGVGLIYDDVLNITWLQDANYASTSGYDGDGLLDWYSASSWAEDLIYAGYSDWRLPTSDSSCAFDVVSYGCIGSEMGNLYYLSLGNIGGNKDFGLRNVGPFSNLSEGHGYWSITEFDTIPDFAFYFHNAMGGQAFSIKSSFHYAWAVRNGDVASVVAPIPEPSSIALLGLALVGIGATRRRKLQA